VKKRLISLFLIFIVHCFASKAQLLDSLKNALEKGRIGLDFKFGGSNAIISQRKAATVGVRAGISFGPKFSFGIGYMGNGKGFGSNPIDVSDRFNNAQYKYLMLEYFCMYTQYYFYKTRHWEFSILPQVGIGNTYYRINQLGINTQTPRTRVVLYEPMMTGEYKILRWLGVGADLGFRFAIKNRSIVKERFTAPMYSFHVDVYWSTLTRILFPEHPIVKKYF